jgi:putative resolvase
MAMYSVGEFSKKVRKSVSTLQRWDRNGAFPALRTPTGRRYYTDDSVKVLLGIPKEKRVPVVYCRVSSTAQKPDLSNQRKVLEDFCIARGWESVETIEEIGGGLNFKRRHFLALMDRIGNGEISRLILAHKDRLVRFGFEYFEHFCSLHGCEIHVLNTQTLSPQEEMVQDLMTIVHCFSSRLYGLRNYRKDLKKALADDSRP